MKYKVARNFIADDNGLPKEVFYLVIQRNYRWIRLHTFSTELEVRQAQKAWEATTDD
jgi:hypothetical protein